MNIKTARAILREDIQAMPLEKLQRHKVRLIDAWRASKAQFGMEQAIRDGFFRRLESESASGFVPRDMWLTHNLEYKMDEADKREQKLLNG